MALTLNTNSYVTVDDADDYLDTRIDSANWFGSTYANKESALVTATLVLDNQAWVGSAVSSSQALAWPRKNATYTDNRMGRTTTFGTTDIPADLKTAVYEQALHLIDNEDLLQQKTQTFESISVGSISVSDSNGDVQQTPLKSDLAMRLIRPLLRKGVQGVGASWWRAN